VQRKTSPGPTVRTVRKATSPKARQIQRAKTSPTKINSGPSKIIRSSVGKAATVKHSASTDAATVAQTGELPVVTPETTVTVGDSVDLSAPPVGLSVPLLSLPKVTLPSTDLPAVSVPGSDLPRITWPHTDLPALGPPASDAVAAAPRSQVHQRAGPVGDPTSARRAPLETARTPQGTVVGEGSTVLIATLVLSSDAWTITSIGPPAMVILDELGQHIRAMEVPALVGSSAALIIAAAVGAAATGAVGSGSAGGGGGLAVVPAILGLPALGGYRRLIGWLRESAFGTPHRPGFSPD
jgi:hypothetical protein